MKRFGRHPEDVRRQFLPHAPRIDTGAVGIAAKVMLTDENRRRLPPRLLEGTGLSMCIGLHEFAADAPTVPGVDGDGAAESTARSAGALFDNTASYVFWAYGFSGSPPFRCGAPE
jgi:salicylate hydroxylase